MGRRRPRSEYERLVATREGRRLLEQERAILGATELVCRLMREKGVSRAGLARKLGQTERHVDLALCGETSLTLRNVSDMLVALGCRLVFSASEIEGTLGPDGTFTCACGASHSRGPVNGAAYRCLACGEISRPLKGKTRDEQE